MWANEHSVETSAAPEQIWRLWADVAGWLEWNGDIERIELIGPFAAGSRILMTPIGDEPVELRITEAVEPDRFVDEADMGEIVVRTVHEARRIDPGRALVTYRMEITGPAADTLGPQIGPEISGDFPETLSALVARAESSRGGTPDVH
jgi:NADPH-dependent 2,4-dienoyl-CoA reductase/sulfur reductase-like enzyme